MSSKLSGLVDNLSGIYDKECIYCRKKRFRCNVNLSVLKMMDYITNAKYAEKNVLS